MKLPIFFENSKVPIILSYVSPIEIGAITVGPFIFIRGTASEVLRNHERIHWEQYKELYIIGFLFLYVYYWLQGYLISRDGKAAYYSIPFEREAYANDQNLKYLESREKKAWSKYKI